MDLRSYVGLLVRHWILIVGTIAIGLIAATALLISATPLYSSTAQIVFTAHGGQSGQDLAYAGSYAESRMQTYKTLATTNDVLQPVIDKLGLDETPKQLSKRISVEVSQINTFLRLSASDKSAPQAAKIANEVASQLVDVVGVIEAGQTRKVSAIDGAIVSPAERSKSPADPNKPLYLAVGGLLGLVVSIGAVAVMTATGLGEGRKKSGTVTTGDG